MTDLNSEADDQRIAAELAGCVELLDVRLFRADIEALELPNVGTLQWSFNQKAGIEVLEDSEEGHGGFGTGHFIATVDYRVSVKAENGDDDAEPQFAATFGALYLVPDDRRHLLDDAKSLNAFAKTVASLTLYPYARELISTATSRVGLPALILPPFRVPSPWHGNSSSEDLEPNSEA